MFCRPHQGGTGQAKRGVRIGLLLATFVAAMIALGACASNSPTYPLDIFSEMHNQQSYRIQEPQRLAAPDQSVFTTGSEVPFTAEQAGKLTNPVAASSAVLQHAGKLYQVNCVACHGPQGHGNGVVAAYFTAANAIPPVDFRGKLAMGMNDGTLFYVITHGVRDPTTLVGMPAFRYLLNEEDRWALVHFIRQVQKTK